MNKSGIDVGGITQSTIGDNGHKDPEEMIFWAKLNLEAT